MPRRNSTPDRFLRPFAVAFTRRPVPASRGSCSDETGKRASPTGASLSSIWLALPFAPAIAIAAEDFVGGVNVLVVVEGRIRGVGCRVPGTGVEDLEDA